jgi:hypothetical protein
MARLVPLEDKEVLDYKAQRVLKDKKGNKVSKG